MILVFGSLNIDIVMQVDKLPRPGETVLCPDFQMIAGGKGSNQAIAAAKAGAEVKLFGKIGDDAFGRTIMGALNESSVDITGLSISKEKSTGCASISVDAEGENMISVASGANLEAKQDEIPDFLLAKGTLLLLQLETSLEENWKLVKRAKKIGAKVVLNLAPAHDIPQEILESLDILVMNESEAAFLALYLGFEVISPTVVAKRVSTSFGITCLVTLGKRGAMACSPEGTWEVKAMDIESVDTTAAGDAFVGVFAASLDEGMDLPHALQYASVASGLACLTKGAHSSLPSQTNIKQNLNKIPLPKQTSSL